jgi:ergothioneine biosynthesis protein EgtC
MCRFALYLGPPVTISSLVTEPAHSLIHQSYQSRELEEPLNGDGFGIAWFVPGLEGPPPVFKEVSPAWSNRNLQDIARATRTHCLLAHVRAATPGIAVTALNCHPFAWDRFAFMHNGAIGGWFQIQRQVRERLSDEAYAQVAGTTDSEHLFALFADRFRERPRDEDPLERMAGALLDAIREVETIRQRAGVTVPSRFNLALADGERAVATRYVSYDPERAHSLYVHRGGDLRLRTEGPPLFPTGGSEAVLIASEPLSEDPGWRRVRPNHVLLVGPGGALEERPIAP